MTFTGGRLANPYLVGSPIKDPSQFFGRQREIGFIFERIMKRESTSLVGQRRSGRTSVLYQVMNEIVQAKYLPEDHSLLSVYVDPHLGIETPHDFFHKVFRSKKGQEPSFMFQTHDQIDYGQVTEYLEEVEQKRLILLLDEFECVVEKDAFPLDFFTFLRAIANNYDVSFITATQMELHKCCRPEIVGSPFWNIFAPVHIGPFSQEEFDHFIEETSRRSGVLLQGYKNEIADLAGRFPFFVQMACWHYFETVQIKGGQVSISDHAAIRRQFAEEARGHFIYAWDHLDSDEQEMVLALAKGEAIAEKKDVITRLKQKGYIVNSEVFSSVFAEFALQMSRGIRLDEAGNIFVNGLKKINVRDLTPQLRRLLLFLYEKRGQTRSRDDIAFGAWGSKEGVSDETIDTHVHRLRQKIEPDPSNPHYIITEWGEGFRLITE
jgi:hypothetical protein